MRINNLILYISACIIPASCAVEDFIEENRFDLHSGNTLSTKAYAENTLSLTFDFTDANIMTEWPQAEMASQDDPAVRFTCPYEVDGVTYNFVSSQPHNATKLQWPYYRASSSGKVPGLYIPKQRYLGFPVVEGYALTSVQFTVGANNAANYIITGRVAEETDTPVHMEGGEVQSNSNAKEFTFDLTNSESGTQYWMKVWNKPSVITSMTLIYSRRPKPSTKVRTFDFTEVTSKYGSNPCVPLYINVLFSF